MHAYILLDRSGSMAERWVEALSSVNAFATDLAKRETTRDARITLATFDAQAGLMFDVIRRGVQAASWPAVTDADASPRGMTPLFDAIGQLTAMADADAPDKAVIVVMTDGEENASREVTREAAKAAFDRARRKGWQVVFLGADFDAFGQAAAVGTRAAQTLNVAAAAMPAMMERVAARAAGYAETGQDIAWSDEDRKEAATPQARP